MAGSTWRMMRLSSAEPMLRLLTIGICWCAITGAEAEDLATRLRLEAHGFASFGWLQTWGNDWLGGTEGGTTEFHEAAVNALARPFDRVRLGAQLFARDLGRYDNSRVQLDWAYADWRAADEFGLRVGRFKIPHGLYNDLLDTDVARTPVFLPVSIYAVRTRDLFISTDGALAYGFSDAAGAGSFEWAIFLGDKRIERSSGSATYFADVGFGAPIEDIDTSWTWGGMGHWTTPVPGVGFRLSVAGLRDLTITGGSPLGGLHTTVDDYIYGIGSLVWEIRQWTISVEYGRIYGRGSIELAAVPGEHTLRDDREAGYVSASWRQRPWLEWHVALEGERARIDGDDTHAYRAVVAAALRPLPNWTCKIELQQVDGTANVFAADNPAGVDHQWQILALKTTVDF